MLFVKEMRGAFLQTAAHTSEWRPSLSAGVCLRNITHPGSVAREKTGHVTIATLACGSLSFNALDAASARAHCHRMARVARLLARLDSDRALFVDVP